LRWEFAGPKVRQCEMAGDSIADHFENPGQGANPNSALTRPQAIGPLTLVGQLSGGVTQRETPSTINSAVFRLYCKVVI
jgi:hypothetical protein